jgi:hypothetical protein
MFCKEEAEKIRQKLLDKGYSGFFLRYGCKEEDSSCHHLYFLIKNVASDTSNELYDDFGEVIPKSEIISMNSDESLRIIETWMTRIDIHPNPVIV